MAASSPRKAAAKKAAPKRTPDERAQQSLAAFEQFRARANEFNIRSTGGTFTPRVYSIPAADIGDGIKQDAVFRQPSTLSDRTRMQRYMSALKRGDTDVIPDMVIGLSDPYTFERIMRYLDTQSTDPEDADALLFGFAVTVMENLNGVGSVDVPGGSTGS